MALIDDTPTVLVPHSSSRRPASRPHLSPGLSWRQRYARYLALTDLLVIVWAAAGAHFAQAIISLGLRGPIDPFGAESIITSCAVVLLWILMLAVFDTRDAKVVGFGSEEYKRVLQKKYADAQKA